MIRQIFKMIWNERKSNSLLMLELVVVFCVMWFCAEYLYGKIRLYCEPAGYDTEHVYTIDFRNSGAPALYIGHGQFGDEPADEVRDEVFNTAMDVVETVRRYPGVENVVVGKSYAPYTSGSRNNSMWAGGDTIPVGMSYRYVPPEYFDMFRIPLESGRLYEQDYVSAEYGVATGDRNGKWGNIPMDEVTSLHSNDHTESGDIYGITHKIVGVVPRIKRMDGEDYRNFLFLPQRREDVDLMRGILIRVSPAADRGFAQRFTKDMEERLSVEPYHYAGIKPLEQYRREWNEFLFYPELRKVLAVALFLVLNVFLGIIGTFWFRTQARRSETGLRMAVGASRRSVRSTMVAEAVVLVFIASVAGTFVCLNLGRANIYGMFDMWVDEREMFGLGHWQDAINYCLTFGFMAVVAAFAVWYPARQAAKTQPAGVLHEE